MAAIAWPELTPGAACPNTFTAGRLLKRSSVSGPDEYFTVASADTGTISVRDLDLFTVTDDVEEAVGEGHGAGCTPSLLLQQPRTSTSRRYEDAHD